VARTTTKKDELDAVSGEALDALLNEAEDELAGGPDDLDDEAELEAEVEADEGAADEEIGSYSFDGAFELDFRPLTDGATYNLEIVAASKGRSKKGNLQATVVFRVFNAENPDEDGVTPQDYAPLMEGPATPEKQRALWKILTIAGCAGHGIKDAKGRWVALKPGTKLSDLVGCHLRAVVSIDTEYDGTPRNRIVKYLPPLPPAEKPAKK
jgi:hypothetical protein